MTQHSTDLNRIFQALSDPTRRAMLARLLEGPAPVTALAGPTGMALPTVMRHLSVLEDADLIRSTKQGRIRLCHARPDTIVATERWLVAQRAIWEGRADRLEALLATLDPEPLS